MYILFITLQNINLMESSVSFFHKAPIYMALEKGNKEIFNLLFNMNSIDINVKQIHFLIFEMEFLYFL